MPDLRKPKRLYNLVNIALLCASSRTTAASSLSSIWGAHSYESHRITVAVIEAPEAMERPLQVEYSYRMEGHFAVGEVDTDFYKTLPGVQEEYLNSETGRLEVPIPSFDQSLTVVGTTSLSTTEIAKAIKTWLVDHKTRITLSFLYSDSAVEFKGPNLIESVWLITGMIDELVAKEERSDVIIRALQIDSE